MWNIGSVTKTFVAVVVLQLADEGKIDLDAGIEQYMPDLANADHITPRELLQHTSGLGEYNDKPAVLNDAHRVWTPAELIAVAEDAGRVGEPGGPFHYSNTNYIAPRRDHRQGHRQTRGTYEVQNKDRRAARHDQQRVQLGADLPVGDKSVDGAFVDSTHQHGPSTAGAAGGLESYWSRSPACSPRRSATAR